MASTLSRRRMEKALEPVRIGKALPQVLVDMDVYEAALSRIRWLFEEFDGKVVVSNSGGKDSTVVLELAAIVARERGEKLQVYWLDQECEFEATVDYQRYIMYERDDIEFTWYQIPFLLENSTNHEDPWLRVWGEGEEWVREREPGSVHENRYGQMYWNKLLDSVAGTDWNGYAVLDGIRAEESPARRLVSRSRPAYKWCTWSVRGGQASNRKEDENPGARFHVIYDWSYRDVWKAINDNEWRYNAHYDHMFQYGVPTRSMRVSNYHHESALKALHFLQEIEPRTWEAAVRRLEGLNTYGHLRKDQYPTVLPYMFESWWEYMMYLIDNLVRTEENRAVFRKQYENLVQAAKGRVDDQACAKEVVKSVIGNDLYGTRVKNYIIGLNEIGRSQRAVEVGRRRYQKETSDER